MFRPVSVKFATAPKFSCAALARVKPITLRHTFSTSQSTQNLKLTCTHSLLQSRSQRLFVQRQLRFFSENTRHEAPKESSGAEHATEPKIQVEGKDIPKPVHSFDQIPNFPSALADNIKAHGWTHMIKVQQHAIPAALNQRDLLISSQTGTGKTAAFLIPMLMNILNEPKTESLLKTRLEYIVYPRGLILVPTRELAQQVAREADKLAAGTDVKTMAIFGGVPAQQQLSKMYRLKPDIIVATPGRFMDLRSRGCIGTNKINHVVLDEGDMMLDMGFIPAIQDILGDPNFNPKRQLMMFSATFPKGIKEIAEQFLKNPVKIFVGLNKPSALVTQKVVYVSGNSQKESLLMDFVKSAQGRVLVFCETKRRTDALFHYLRFSGIRVACIHGDHIQSERDLAVEAFVKGDVSVLVATNVAARGLDIKGVSHVVNYDFPQSMEPYIHRIGRTGRAGVPGTALSFFGDVDFDRAEDLVKVLQESNQQVPEFLTAGRQSRNLAVGGGYEGYSQQSYRPRSVQMYKQAPFLDGNVGAPQQGGYERYNQQGYPPQQRGFPQQRTSPEQRGFPQQRTSPEQRGFPQQRGYPEQRGYPQQQRGFPQQYQDDFPQGGYSQQGYPQQQRGFPQQQRGGFPEQRGFPEQQGFPEQRQQRGFSQQNDEGFSIQRPRQTTRNVDTAGGPSGEDQPRNTQIDLMSLLSENDKK